MATNPLGAFNYNYVSVTGRLSSVNYPGGQSTVFSYFDNTGDQRLQEIKNLNPAAAIISQFDYTYNAVGNIPSWTQNNSGLAGAQRYDFSYDAADQLKEAILKNAGSGAEIKPYLYSYDNAGNRTDEQADTNVTGASHNNLNQLTSRTAGGSLRFKGTISEPGTVTISGTAVTVDGGLNFTGYTNVTGGTNTVPIVARDTAGNARTNNYQVTVPALNQSPTYDLNGNLTGDGTKTYEWDAVNRLTAINSGTHRSEFSYDGLSRRVKIVEKDNGSVTSTKNLVWCGMEICEERDAGNNVMKRYDAQGMRVGSTNYFYTRDHLGTIRELTDNSGVVHARYDYDPYGRRSANLITTNAAEADFGFTGHYYHAPNTLHLAPYRAYSADLGRWLSRDPIEEAGGVNLYGYVANSPLSFVDPLGLAMEGVDEVWYNPWSWHGFVNRGGWLPMPDYLAPSVIRGSSPFGDMAGAWLFGDGAAVQVDNAFLNDIESISNGREGHQNILTNACVNGWKRDGLSGAISDGIWWLNYAPVVGGYLSGPNGKGFYDNFNFSGLHNAPLRALGVEFTGKSFDVGNYPP